ncbi:MAG TPA: hypothetical protein PK669_07315 [Methanosarcina thermophila]|nr:hypothetical protein [Methanosarcina thermophila]NLU57889.1 hypothetical protein [Methanosarcina thermophila]HOA68947.1 hypothetical protein [Methanosarcina thermophila]HOQ66405.1 hypothetical protein [Methanosarcina thermophila]HPT81654.1 hypothetical protein [Methanosarcina thermophila]HPZ20275.1 hypothetical protein [Methanosarcina thermophila]
MNHRKKCIEKRWHHSRIGGFVFRKWGFILDSGTIGGVPFGIFGVGV